MSLHRLKSPRATDPTTTAAFDIKSILQLIFITSNAPVVLGGGKRLFDGFDETMSLEHVSLLQSPFATHITYRVVR